MQEVFWAAVEISCLSNPAFRVREQRKKEELILILYPVGHIFAPLDINSHMFLGLTCMVPGESLVFHISGMISDP